jgi:hypothetical protein
MGQLAQEFGGERGKKVGRELILPLFISIPNRQPWKLKFLLEVSISHWVLVSGYQFKQ